jgi:hypothetical protein
MKNRRSRERDLRFLLQESVAQDRFSVLRLFEGLWKYTMKSRWSGERDLRYLFA